MSAPWPLFALTYLSLLVFVVGVLARTVKYARAPMHLRWELYPVPHEKDKEYGGSYFEEVDWWSHSRKTTRVGEIRAMLEEMLLIRSLWHRNRTQWYASFPFHAGLYLLFGLIVLMILSAGARAAGAQSLASVLQTPAGVVGAVGLAGASWGAVALLWKRLADAKLRGASNLFDYVNLLILLAVFLAADVAYLSTDNSFSLLRDYLWSLLTLSPAAAPAAVVTEVAAVSLFLIYLPFTHMTHFVAKYFAYHQVRWDDAPSLGDPNIEARMAANLARPVPWAGPHIQQGKSWAEVATEAE